MGLWLSNQHSERFDVRAEVEFQRPRRAVLFDEVPVLVSDFIRVERSFTMTDLSIDHDVSDMDTFRAEFAGHRFGHSPSDEAVEVLELDDATVLIYR